MSDDLEMQPYEDDENIKPFIEDFEDDGEGGVNAYRIAMELYRNPLFYGAFGKNTFDESIWARAGLPWEPELKKPRMWLSEDTSKLIVWLEGVLNKNITDSAVHHALTTVASFFPFNSLTDLLDSLEAEYDGKEHHPFIDYFGCKPTPYNLAVEQFTLNGMVMRAYEPGCKFDIVPIFISRQGLGKSTICRYLALEDQYFTDELGDVKTRESALSIQGRWVVEVSELANFSGKEPEQYKKFFTRTVDDYRPMYGDRYLQHPRHTVFFGTTNQHEVLIDETGNRRYYPIECDIETPKRDIENVDEARYEARQAIAERVVTYKQNGTLPLIFPKELEDEAKAAQTEAMIQDSDKELILEWLDDKPVGTRVCARLISENVLDNLHPDKWLSQKINTIMDNLPGWEYMGRERFEGHGKNPKTYRKSGETIVSNK